MGNSLEKSLRNFIIYLQEQKLIDDNNKISKFLFIDELRYLQSIGVIEQFPLDANFLLVIKSVVDSGAEIDFDKFIIKHRLDGASGNFLNKLKNFNLDEFVDSRCKHTKRLYDIDESILDLLYHQFFKTVNLRFVRSDLLIMIQTAKSYGLYGYIDTRTLDENLYCSGMISELPKSDLYSLSTRLRAMMYNYRKIYQRSKLQRLDVKLTKRLFDCLNIQQSGGSKTTTNDVTFESVESSNENVDFESFIDLKNYLTEININCEPGTLVDSFNIREYPSNSLASEMPQAAVEDFKELVSPDNEEMKKPTDSEENETTNDDLHESVEMESSNENKEMMSPDNGELENPTNSDKNETSSDDDTYESDDSSNENVEQDSFLDFMNYLTEKDIISEHNRVIKLSVMAAELIKLKRVNLLPHLKADELHRYASINSQIMKQSSSNLVFITDFFFKAMLMNQHHYNKSKLSEVSDQETEDSEIIMNQHHYNKSKLSEVSDQETQTTEIIGDNAIIAQEVVPSPILEINKECLEIYNFFNYMIERGFLGQQSTVISMTQINQLIKTLQGANSVSQQFDITSHIKKGCNCSTLFHFTFDLASIVISTKNFNLLNHYKQYYLNSKLFRQTRQGVGITSSTTNSQKQNAYKSQQILADPVIVEKLDDNSSNDNAVSVEQISMIEDDDDTFMDFLSYLITAKILYPNIGLPIEFVEQRFFALKENNLLKNIQRDQFLRHLLDEQYRLVKIENDGNGTIFCSQSTFDYLCGFRGKYKSSKICRARRIQQEINIQLEQKMTNNKPDTIFNFIFHLIDMNIVSPQNNILTYDTLFSEFKNLKRQGRFWNMDEHSLMVLFTGLTGYMQRNLSNPSEFLFDKKTFDKLHVKFPKQNESNLWVKPDADNDTIIEFLNYLIAEKVLKQDGKVKLEIIFKKFDKLKEMGLLNNIPTKFIRHHLFGAKHLVKTDVEGVVAFPQSSYRFIRTFQDNFVTSKLYKKISQSIAKTENPVQPFIAESESTNEKPARNVHLDLDTYNDFWYYLYEKGLLSVDKPVKKTDIENEFKLLKKLNLITNLDINELCNRLIACKFITLMDGDSENVFFTPNAVKIISFWNLHFKNSMIYKQRKDVDDFLCYLYDQNIFYVGKILHNIEYFVDIIKEWQKFGAFLNVEANILMNHLILERNSTIVYCDDPDSSYFLVTNKAEEWILEHIDEYRKSELCQRAKLCKMTASISANNPIPSEPTPLISERCDSNESENGAAAILRDDTAIDFLCYLSDKGLISTEKPTVDRNLMMDTFDELQKLQCFKNFSRDNIISDMKSRNGKIVFAVGSDQITFSRYAFSVIKQNLDEYVSSSEVYRTVSSIDLSIFANNPIPSEPTPLISERFDSNHSVNSVAAIRRDDTADDFLCYLSDKGLISTTKPTINRNLIMNTFDELKKQQCFKNISRDNIISDMRGKIVFTAVGSDQITFSRYAFSAIKQNFDEYVSSSEVYRTVSSVNLSKTERSLSNFQQSAPEVSRRDDNTNDFLCYLKDKGLISKLKPTITYKLMMDTFDKLKNQGLFKKIKRELIVSNMSSHNRPIINIRSNSITFTRHGFEVIEAKFETYASSSEVYQFKLNSENKLTKPSVSSSDLQLTTAQLNFLSFVDNELLIRHIHTFNRLIDHDFCHTSKCCQICRVNFSNEHDFRNHLNNHNNNGIGCPLLVMEAICHFSLSFKLEPDQPFVKFTLKNMRLGIKINRIFMFTGKDTIEYWDKNRFPMENGQLEESLFQISRTLFQTTPHGYQIYIHFESGGFDYIERHDFFISKPLPRLLVFPESFNRKDDNTVATREKELRTTPIPYYYPSLTMRVVFDAKFMLQPTMKKVEISLLEIINHHSSKGVYERLNPQNYVNMMRRLIEIEDIYCEKMMREFDKREETLHYRNGYYVLPVENLSEHRPSLLPYDEVIVTPEKLQPGIDLKKQQVEGCITYCEEEYIVFKLDKNVDCEVKYRIHFEMNRNNFRLEHRALDIVKLLNLSSFFFPEKVPQKIGDKTLSLQWFNKNIETNPEQKQAVTNIVLGLAHPLPYIIFGPPGTGKTMTVVESIVQLYTVNPSSRILITTGSNAACNEITSRLLKYIPQEDMQRLFSISQEQNSEKIDKEIIEMSNLNSGMHFYPAIEVITSYRIILSTVSVAGKLVQASINPRHFTHVFIDECGSITETMALVPISGMITTFEKLHGSVIIAGDPLQLGPILNSTRADELGLGISMLDRLMNTPVYQRDPDTKMYNAQIITKLLINYRSHPTIIKLPNEMFYDGELKTGGKKENISWALNWRILPNPKVPIIFNAVSGQMRKEKNSPSWYNLEEIKRVKYYLNLLTNKKINGNLIRESDIGIISPYRKQCQKIRTSCLKRRWNIEVASVESFQGREKPIIILSTVRSRTTTKSLGFLVNEKRFNVALTRAKALLIVVGDPKLLKNDPHWRRLIEYVVENGCCHGETIKLD